MAYMRGAYQFKTDALSREEIIGLINVMRGFGIRAFRFTRQVPATPSYPKGISSTQWLDLKSYTPKKIENLIGGMMQPGIDFMRYMMILEDDIHRMPQSIIDAAERAKSLAGYVE